MCTCMHMICVCMHVCVHVSNICIRKMKFVKVGPEKLCSVNLHAANSDLLPGVYD